MFFIFFVQPTMLLLKMPVEEPKRPAATPLKRVGPFEVLPLPQQTAAKTPQRLLTCRCRNSKRCGAATPSGRENRSLRTTHHDLQDLRKAPELRCKYRSYGTNNDPKSQNLCKHFRERSLQHGVPSSSRDGALAVSRSAELVTSQVKACALQSSGLGPFAL